MRDAALTVVEASPLIKRLLTILGIPLFSALCFRFDIKQR